MDEPKQLFEVMSPLGFTVRCYEDYWHDKVLSDHPVMAERVEAVKQTLVDRVEVRVSRQDAQVFLFYNPDEKRLVCVVARQLNGDGFLITAYPTDAMKKGDIVWQKSQSE